MSTKARWFSRFSGVAALMLCSSLAQFGIDLVIAFKFGSTPQTDALFVALSVPLTVFLMLSASTRFSLVPVLVEFKQAGSGTSFGPVLTNLLGLVFLTGSVAAVGCGLFAPWMVRLLAPGFAPGEAQQAAGLLRVVAPVLLLGPLAVIMEAILNALERFYQPAARNLWLGTLVIVTTLSLRRWLGIYSVAWGYLLAFAVFTVSLAPIAWRARGGGPLRIRWRDPALGKLARTSQWPLLGNLLLQGMRLFERGLASYLGPGSVSALNYGNRIVQGLQTILAFSAITVTLPQMSRLVLEERWAEIHRLVQFNLKLGFFLATPVMAIGMALPLPLVQMLFEHGRFGHEATVATASLLFYYAPSLVFFCLQPMLTATLYAFQDTKGPFLQLATRTALMLLLELILVRYWGLVGIAVATTIARVLLFTGLMRLVQKRVGPIWDRGFLRFVGQVCLLGGLLGLGLKGITYGWGWGEGLSGRGPTAALWLLVAAALLLYGALSSWLGLWSWRSLLARKAG